MGRFIHEDVAATDDGKTVYLTNDNNPAVFFKFETVKPFDYSDGQLYAYQQSQDGETGSWIEMPMDTMSLLFANKKAIELEATRFIRHEWIEEVNGKLYITETGSDEFDWSKLERNAETAADHINENLKTSDDNYDDPFGRILEFDPSTNRMRSYLEGGYFANPMDVFSNPDCLTSVTIGGKTYLVISEDIYWCDRGRVSPKAEKEEWVFNEIYFLDMSIENPTVDDLLRFAVAPKESETTGVIFLPDGSMIVNIQHPGPDNPPPFNKSCTVLIQGFNK